MFYQTDLNGEELHRAVMLVVIHTYTLHFANRLLKILSPDEVTHVHA